MGPVGPPSYRASSRLYLWGAEDAWLPVAQGRKLASLIPGCIIREVPDAGHLMQEDAPEAIIAEALAFFRT